MLLILAVWFLLAFSAAAAAGQQDLDNQKSIEVSVDQSVHLETPWPVKRVSVTNPEVADVKVLSPEQILVMGKAVGTTDLLMWSEDEKAVQVQVQVELDLTEVKTRLRELFPNADLEVSRSKGTILIKGQVSRVEEAMYLKQYMDTRGVNYVDMTRVAGPQQVLLKVRVAEVSRSAVREMTVNLFHTSDNFFGGSQIGSSGGPFNPISIGVEDGSIVTESLPFTFTEDVSVSSGATMFFGFPRAELEFFLRALAENQYLRLLAEPNLVTRSGEEASFLAGGEFPVPVVQSVGSGGGTSISIEYKEFGVRLNFRPVVLGEGTIRLRVRPEVSELSDVGSVSVEGFTVPALISRRADATLELNSGETFAMAGLISQTTRARNSRIPGLGNLPVLGTLFRSVRYQREETELVVLVTASLVQPLRRNPLPPTPGVLHSRPADWELYLMGRIEGEEPAKLSPRDVEYMEELGLDKLVGPGAWESYEQQGAQSEATLRPRESEQSTNQ